MTWATWTDILLAGWIALLSLAVVAVARRGRAPRPLQPTCSCKHGYGMHEDGMRCAYSHHTFASWLDQDGPRQCRCRRYDGPDPAMFGITA